MKNKEIINTIMLAGFVLLFFALLLVVLLQAILELNLLPLLITRAVVGTGF